MTLQYQRVPFVYMCKSSQSYVILRSALNSGTEATSISALVVL